MDNQPVCCPKCARLWDEPTCEQAISIELFGECIPCRFLNPGMNNLYGSGEGSKSDLDLITKTRLERNGQIQI